MLNGLTIPPPCLTVPSLTNTIAMTTISDNQDIDVEEIRDILLPTDTLVNRVSEVITDIIAAELARSKDELAHTLAPVINELIQDRLYQARYWIGISVMIIIMFMLLCGLWIWRVETRLPNGVTDTTLTDVPHTPSAEIYATGLNTAPIGLRRDPNFSSPIRHTLPPNTPLTAARRSDDWFFVYTADNQQSGWVYKYLVQWDNTPLTPSIMTP